MPGAPCRDSFSLSEYVITLKNIAEDAKLRGKLAGIVEEYTQAIQGRRGTHCP